jgi:hypothetical protein
MESFGDVIALWPSLSDLAADAGVAYGVAKQWRMRDSIPAPHWAALVDAARNRGFSEVTTARLAEIARLRAERVAAEQQNNASGEAA